MKPSGRAHGPVKVSSLERPNTYVTPMELPRNRRSLLCTRRSSTRALPDAATQRRKTPRATRDWGRRNTQQLAGRRVAVAACPLPRAGDTASRARATQHAPRLHIHVDSTFRQGNGREPLSVDAAPVHVVPRGHGARSSHPIPSLALVARSPKVSLLRVVLSQVPKWPGDSSMSQCRDLFPSVFPPQLNATARRTRSFRALCHSFPVTSVAAAPSPGCQYCRTHTPLTYYLMYTYTRAADAASTCTSYTPRPPPVSTRTEHGARYRT